MHHELRVSFIGTPDEANELAAKVLEVLRAELPGRSSAMHVRVQSETVDVSDTLTLGVGAAAAYGIGDNNN